MRATQRKRRKVFVSAAVILVAAAITGTYFIDRCLFTTCLTDKDTIVLSDFDNKTGDSLFDDTLKQGLSVQLEQSPFLYLLSERKVNQTLKRASGRRRQRESASGWRRRCRRRR